MRVAVLSDLHGNPFALDAVLADLPAGVDELVCLGDVAIGPFPHETIWRLRELGCAVVMGNWDTWILDGVPDLFGEVGPRLSAQGRWCSARLEREDRAFLRGFARTVDIDLDGTRAVCFHGSPRSFTDLLLPDVSRAELDRALAGTHADLFLAGHTHLQMLRRRPLSLYANVGSVGLPFSEGPSGGSLRVSRWAEYALATVDERGLALEFRRVPYDVEEMLAAARASGMPHAEWWASCWTDGGKELASK
jgi:predicted phosphodiesterase